MSTFALVAEGWTDVAVIENIIDGVYKGQSRVNPLMPLRDATDEARAATKNYSNWELVIQYLASDQITIALASNDYLIVQIDTDQGNHPNFGLELAPGGKLKPIGDIVTECRQILLTKIHKSISAEDKERIIFAIPVLSTECWLVGLHNTAHVHSSSKGNNCEGRLAGVIKRQMRIAKEYRCYRALSDQLRKAKPLADIRTRMPCLEAFISSLP